MNLKTERFEHLIQIASNRTFLSGATTTLVQQGNTMYLANENGLGQFSLSDYIIKTLANPAIDKEVHIIHMAEKNEEIWIATAVGVYIYSTKNKSYTDTPETLTPLKNITFIFHGQKTWIGTANGLWVYDPKNNELLAVSGMRNKSIQGIVSEEKALWLTTKSGLYQLSLETDKLRSFKINDGLQSDFFNIRAIGHGVDDHIYLGGNEGITVFDPSRMKFLEETIAPLYTTISILNGDEIKKTPINQQTITLDYNESTFALDFYVPDYINPDNLQYKYRILGLSDQYFFLDGKSVINITDLSPGTYNIEAYTSNIDGVWSAPSTMSIIVKPPFWASWYAFSTYVIVIVALFFAREKYRKEEQKRLENIISERTQEVRAQAEEIKQLDKAKTRFFSNISHEFRTPLTLIQGPIESVLTNRVSGDEIKQNLEIANRNVRSLRNLIDEILEFNKMEVGELEVTYRPVLIADYLTEFSQVMNF